jgi:L-lactate dehydrogenase complex protein LldE
VIEEVVSTKMIYEKLRAMRKPGPISAESSHLMHQRGCAEHIGVPKKFIHIAEILNGTSA